MTSHRELASLPRLCGELSLRAMTAGFRQGAISPKNTHVPMNFVLRRAVPEIQDAETTSCSPVMSRDELTRIRNNVRSSFADLDQEYRSIGVGLAAESFVQAYDSVWEAAEGGSYCHYNRDEDVVEQILNRLREANVLFENAGNLFERNFEKKLQPMRKRISEFEIVVDTVEVDVRKIFDAYNFFWDSNFEFSLYWGFDAQLDALMTEYNALLDRSNVLYERGVSVVQRNFERAFDNVQDVYQMLKGAYDHWRDVDGFNGYNRFSETWTLAVEASVEFERYVVVDSEENSRIIARVEELDVEMTTWKNGFPEYFVFKDSRGIKRGGGLPEHKFFAENRMLKLLREIGSDFATLSADDESHYEFRNLFVTSLSYPHNGKMPPHSEHRGGLDCDLWARRLDQTKEWFDKERTKELVVAILKRGVTRLIYTHEEIVKEANKEVPKENAVAVSGSGHTDHLHFDIG